MAAREPARERNHVARVQLALAVGRAQGDLARDDDQELLVRPVPVERERGLAGRQLVEARAEQLPAQRVPQPPSRPRVARSLALLVSVVAEEIGRAHHAATPPTI